MTHPPTAIMRRAAGSALRLAGLSCLILAMAGCGDDSGTGPETATVGPAGGVLNFAGGRVTLVFPAGAVSAPLSVTVAAARQFPDSSALVRGTVYDVRPSQTQLDHSVQLLIAYDERNVPPTAEENDLRLNRAAGTEWRLIPNSAVNSGNDLVSAPIESFGLFAILVVPPLPDR